MAQEISEVYHEVFDTFYSRPNKAWLDLQLSLPQWKTLVLIAEGKNSTIGALAGRNGHRRADGQSSRGQARTCGLRGSGRGPEDRRRTLVSLSSEGRKLVDELIGPRRELLREATRSLAEKDLKDLLRLLKAMGESMKRSAGEEKKGGKA